MENDKNANAQDAQNENKEQAARLAREAISSRSLGSLKAADGGVGKGVSEGAKNLVNEGINKAAETGIAAAATAINPAAGQAARVALKFVKPKDLVKIKLKIILWSVAAAMTLLLILLATIAGSGTSLLMSSPGNNSFGTADPDGGGYPVLEPEQKANATVIIKAAVDAGLNSDAAAAGIVASLTVANLKNKFYIIPGPMTPVGIFGFTPYEWAPQFWVGVEYEGEGWNDPERLRQSIEFLENPENSSELFYRTFNTSRLLSNGKWKNRSSWDVAKIARESRSKDWEGLNNNEEVPIDLREGDEEDSTWRPNIYDTSMYSAQSGRALSTLLTLYVENPEWRTEFGEFWGTLSFNAQNAAAFYGAGTFTLAPPEQRKFTDGPVIYPNTRDALARAQLFVGNPQFACSDAWFDTNRGVWQGCRAKCDHLAGDIWGYWANSGYWDAKYHWGVALSEGIGRPGNRVPPIGALLFWDTGPQGHVATYIGNGMVVSNLTNGPNGTSVYVVPAEYFENNWGSPYLGWADPVFKGNPAGPGQPGIGLPNKVMCASANDTQRALCEQQSGSMLKQWRSR